MRGLLGRIAVIAVSGVALTITLVPQCGTEGTEDCDSGVGPFKPCSGTFCCLFPGDECGACRCENGQFTCTTGICNSPDPIQPCPDSLTLVSGLHCGSTPFDCDFHTPPATCISAASAYPCGATCHCNAPDAGDGTWECTPTTDCPDGGADAAGGLDASDASD